MKKPKIQVSGGQRLIENYTAAICSVGGEAVAAYCPEPDLSCDGLLLCGGGDIECTLYGQEDRGSQPPDRDRDKAEIALFHAFYEASKPILGICRGMQMINILLGGTMIQDMPAQQCIFHSGSDGDRIHPIRTAEDTILHQLYGPLLHVNSHHHQAVDRLGKGLAVTAWSESGVPEALELPGYPLLGVQFHPERMCFDHRRMDTVDGASIFAWLLKQCQDG